MNALDAHQLTNTNKSVFIDSTYMSHVFYTIYMSAAQHHYYVTVEPTNVTCTDIEQLVARGYGVKISQVGILIGWEHPGPVRMELVNKGLIRI